MSSNPLHAIEQRQRRDVRLLYDTLANAVSNAFDRHTTPGTTITTLDRIRIMADVERSLDVIYGPRKGTDGALTAIVVRDATNARFEPLDAAVARWRAAMTRTLKDRVEREARRG